MAEAVSRMTGKPALAIGTLGPGIANLAPAITCAKVENSPVIFLGGQRARITEQRVRRGRIQFVQQEALVAPSVKSVRQSNMRTRQMRSSGRHFARRCQGPPDRLTLNIPPMSSKRV